MSQLKKIFLINIAYNYFNHRVDAFILDMEKYVILLLNKLIRFKRKSGQEYIEKINLREK